MTTYYSPSERGFYSDEIHGDQRPANAVEIDEDLRQQLLAAQAAGEEIVTGEDGRPRVRERPAPPPAALAAGVARQAQEALAAAAWTLTPELRLPADQKAAWAAYRNALALIITNPSPDAKLPAAPGTQGGNA